MTEAQKPPRELAELYVSIGLPLDELGQLGSEWKRGPWLLAGGDWREFDEAARVEPFLNTTPLQAMQTRRRHRVLGADLATLVPDTSADADGIVVAAAEVVEAPKLTSTAPTAYLLLHMEVTAGTRGGLAAAVKMLARLSRPGWTESQKLVRAVLAGARLHRGRVRGLTLSLVLAGEDRLADSHEELLGRLTALRKDATDPGGWLGEDLLLGDVRARVGTSAVALALNGPGARPLVGTVRAHLLCDMPAGIARARHRASWAPRY